MKFSIIIPFFNAEQYLSTAIDSVIHQTLDFKDNIEIVLIDDGSTDNSQEICLEYKRLFPNNIIYIYTANNGPSHARNIGIENVSPSSDIIGFLDADDYISSNSLENVYTFFHTHKEVNMAVIPLFHLDNTVNPHKLNYRFDKGSRVINILNEYHAIHFHIGGCFFKANILKNSNEWRFRQDLRFWEDALLINLFLLTYKKYGVVSEAKYYYRKHQKNQSLVSRSWYQKSRYIPMLNNCYEFLVSQSINLYNEIIPYIQYLIIYHLRLYLVPKNSWIIYEVLTVQEQNAFFQGIVNLIKKFDDKYIMDQPFPYYYKYFLISLKKNGWPFKPVVLYPIDEQHITITKWTLHNHKWLIEGNFKNKAYNLKKDDRIFIKRKEKIIYTNSEQLDSKSIVIWGNLVRDFTYSGFSVSLPINYVKFQFGLETKEGNTILLNHVNLFKFMIKKVTKTLLNYFHRKRKNE